MELVRLWISEQTAIVHGVSELWISEQTAIISLYSINSPAFYNRDEVCLLRGTDRLKIYTQFL